MSPVICIAIAAGTNDAALQMMEKAYEKTEIVELRIDRMQSPDLNRLIGARKGKIIITNRRKEEGGGFRGDEKDRISCLKEAVMLGADYIDVEMSTEASLREDIEEAVRPHAANTQIIFSWHDFRKTPSDRALRERLKPCTCRNHILKIVTHARTVEDNLRVMNLAAYASAKNQGIIAFCMGEKGRMSRIMSPYFGSLLSYAALDEGVATAPGQMTFDEMREIFRLLNR